MTIYEERAAATRSVGNEGSSYMAAGDLTWTHLGESIEFFWNFPNGVTAHVTGVLERVMHGHSGTTLEVSGYPKTENTSGVDYQEFTVESSAPIEVQ